MQVVLTLALNDIKLFLRDKAGYLWLFIMPIVFIYFFGMAFNFESDPEKKKTSVWIENQDQGIYGEFLMQELGEQGLLIHPISKEEKPLRSITIPKEFSASITEGKKITLEYKLSKKGSSEAHELIKIRLFRSIVALTSKLIEMDSQTEKVKNPKAYLEKLNQQQKQITIKVSYAGYLNKIPSGFSQTLPGTLVLFLLLNLFIYGGTVIGEERQSGVMKRFAVYPISKQQLVFGKILGRVLLAIVQIIYFLLLSLFVFKVSLGRDLFAITLVLLFYSWGCASLSVLVGAFVTNPEKIVALGVLCGNGMGALGGCWWPLEIVPDTMKIVGHFFPTAWAMDALHKLISFGGSLGNIQQELGVLAIFAVVATILASKFLKYQSE